MQFQVKTIKNDDIKNKLLSIGFDPRYVEFGAKKHEFLNLLIQNLPPHSATIIKETALSKGADAAVHRDVLMRSIEFSDVILSGTIKELDEIAESLLMQPFGLKEISKRIKEEIALHYKPYNPLIMGILNVTPDSFSDGGKFLDPKEAVCHAQKLIREGADIIDIGAESTRPGALEVPFEIEIERLKPVLKEIKKLDTQISIDTKNPETIAFALEFGVEIINCVENPDKISKILDIIKNNECKFVITHSRGKSANMDGLSSYGSVCAEVFEELKQGLELGLKKGIASERMIVDVGFGFAKDFEQNFELLKRIKEFNSLGIRQLAGTSRKRFLKSLTDGSIEEADEISALSSFYLFENKVDIIRVHNVRKTKLALDFYRKLQ